jgi:hypothetical protein
VWYDAGSGFDWQKRAQFTSMDPRLGNWEPRIVIYKRVEANGCANRYENEFNNVQDVFELQVRLAFYSDLLWH